VQSASELPERKTEAEFESEESRKNENSTRYLRDDRKKPQKGMGVGKVSRII